MGLWKARAKEVIRMAEVRIGLIQVKQRGEDGYRERCDILLSRARACFEEGADIVFFPEAYQYVRDRDIVRDRAKLAETIGSWKCRCAALAKEYGAYLVPWDYEIEGDRIYNTSYILSREGEEIGRHRKVHLPHDEQKQGFANGDAFRVFDLDFGRVGIMICWDNYFPESARCLGNAGAQLILFPLYGDVLKPQWEIKLRARAIDSSVYVASSQIDGYNEGAFTGIVSPDGEVQRRLDRNVESHAVVSVDLSRDTVTQTTGNRSYRENIRAYTDRCRRPGAYGNIALPAGDTPWEEIFYGNVPKIN